MKKETFAEDKINNPEIVRMEETDRRVRNSDENRKDPTFADVLNIDTTYNRISKDV